MTKTEKAALRVALASAKNYVTDLQVGLRVGYKEIRDWQKDIAHQTKELEKAVLEVEYLKDQLKNG